MTWLEPSALGMIFFVPCIRLAMSLAGLFWRATVALVVVAGDAAPAMLSGLELIVAYLVAVPLGRALTGHGHRQSARMLGPSRS